MRKSGENIFEPLLSVCVCGRNTYNKNQLDVSTIYEVVPVTRGF